ncbi:GGDEF domain-containing protein [Pseudoalteromonas phenolica O-BC30]|nr:GGDEF domain-containing protein [Pseudoalteromonas phenolica O-BC30]
MHSEGRYQQKKIDQEQNWFLAILDIDHFKQVNDTFGHVIGDEVIVLVSQLLKSHFRFDDLLFRYGGEEFAILFMTDNSDQAWKVLDRARELIANTRFPQVSNVTMSIGFIQVGDDYQLSELVNKADMALYFSKDNGRNQVSDYQQLNIVQQAVSGSDIELF